MQTSQSASKSLCTRSLIEMLIFAAVVPLPFSIGLTSVLLLLTLAFNDTGQQIGTITAQYPAVFAFNFGVGLIPALLAGFAYVLMRRLGYPTKTLVVAAGIVAFVATLVGTEVAGWLHLLGKLSSSSSSSALAVQVAGLMASGALGAAALASLLLRTKPSLERGE